MVESKDIYMKYWIIILIVSLIVGSCSKQSEDSDPVNPIEYTDLNVDTGVTYQTIAGFGGANQMWGTQFPNASDMKKAFGTGENELGMSIFRIRIASNPDEWPRIVDVSLEAQKYGTKIIASPWSPPGDLKSNKSEVGGFLLEENYGAFADHLNSFVKSMASEGVNIYAVSIQNEPDIKVSYESCDWTSSQMRDFLRDYGHLIEGVKVAAPESYNFNQNFSNVLLNDDLAVSNLDIIAGHIYGAGQQPYYLAEQNGKEIWMTEYLMNQGATGDWSQLGEDVIWEETLDMLETIHNAMKNNWNAYIWWYLKRYYSFIGDGDQGTTPGEILKRGFSFSHFSRFIRPGFERVEAEIESSGGLVTAYRGDGKTVIILINKSSNSLANINVLVDGASPSKATKYVTTLSSNLTSSEVDLTEGKLVVNALAKSVTTVLIED